jgi:hypothetical protein
MPCERCDKRAARRISVRKTGLTHHPREDIGEDLFAIQLIEVFVEVLRVTLVGQQR